MADPVKLMEMLHPMREPPLPDSIVPAIVMLAVGCVTAALLASLAWRTRRQAGGLRASALAALAATRALAPPERLAAQAALLRRLSRALGGDGTARQQGGAWLENLDRVFRTDFFSKGPGAAYGDALYGRRPSADVEALDTSLAGLFAGMRPISRQTAAS